MVRRLNLQQIGKEQFPAPDQMPLNTMDLSLAVDPCGRESAVATLLGRSRITAIHTHCPDLVRFSAKLHHPIDDNAI